MSDLKQAPRRIPKPKSAAKPAAAAKPKTAVPQKAVRRGPAEDAQTP
jgi:hypothetical protein